VCSSFVVPNLRSSCHDVRSGAAPMHADVRRKKGAGLLLQPMSCVVVVALPLDLLDACCPGPGAS